VERLLREASKQLEKKLPQEPEDEGLWFLRLFFFFCLTELLNFQGQRERQISTLKEVATHPVLIKALPKECPALFFTEWSLLSLVEEWESTSSSRVIPPQDFFPSLLNCFKEKLPFSEELLLWINLLGETVSLLSRFDPRTCIEAAKLFSSEGLNWLPPKITLKTIVFFFFFFFFFSLPSLLTSLIIRKLHREG